MIEGSPFWSALLAFDRAGRGAVAAGIVQGGQVAFRHEVGFANLEHRVRADASTRFQIASLSKQFLAALALLLTDAGLLSLDEDVRGRNAGLEAHPRAITLRHLLSHTSGLLDTFDVMSLAGARIETPVSKEAIDKLIGRQRHLNFPTGEGFAYSNAGFEVAASILEDAAGAPLAALYERHLFAPLGMARTCLVNRDDAIVSDAATGYLVVAGEAQRGRHGIPFNGGAGILSTLDDMLLWGRHLLGDPSPGSLLARMESAPPFPNGAPGSYGLGTYLDHSRSLPVSGHGGLLPGFTSVVVRCSSQGTSAVVLTNSSDADANQLARSLLHDALPSLRRSRALAGIAIPPGRYFDAARNEMFEVQHGGSDAWALRNGWRVPLALQADGSVAFDDPLIDGWISGPSYLDLVEWGRRWSLRRIPAGPDAEHGSDRFVGCFAHEDVPTLLRFSHAAGGLVLTIEGVFGQASYALERIDDDLFRGCSPAGTWMPFAMLIHFASDGKDAPASSLRVTTDRTKALVFKRQPASAGDQLTGPDADGGARRAPNTGLQAGQASS